MTPDEPALTELLEAMRLTLDSQLFGFLRAELKTIERLDVWQQKIIEWFDRRGIDL